MLTQPDASSIDNCLTGLPALLAERGMRLKQKRGYKAGKISASRNWCHLVDGNIQPTICSKNTHGALKTWKLFARFDVSHPPLWPWDKLQRGENENPQGMIMGNDVWGVSYEDVQDLLKTATNRKVVERLAADLETSFSYSRRRYCWR